MFDTKVLDDDEPISAYRKLCIIVVKNDDHTIFLMSRADGNEGKDRKR